MKEYGGYLEWEYYHGRPYYKDTLMFNSGSSAIEYFFKVKGIKTVYLPYYLGSSVTNIAKKMGLNIIYYNIQEDFLPSLSHKMVKNELLFLVNYFNQLTEKNILELSERFSFILLDNTQAFFKKTIKGVPTVYSCRKYFGIPDGSYLFMEQPDWHLYFSLPEETVLGSLRHLVGRFEQGAQGFYKDFQNHENFVYREGCKRISRFSENLLRSFDYKRIVEARHRNQEILHKVLGDFNQLQFDVNCNTFMYPFLIKEGEYLKQELIRRKIYVPTLWKEALDFPELNRFASHLVKDLVLLPIDQRYGEKDMQYISDIVLQIMEDR